METVRTKSYISNERERAASPKVRTQNEQRIYLTDTGVNDVDVIMWIKLHPAALISCYVFYICPTKCQAVQWYRSRHELPSSTLCRKTAHSDSLWLRHTLTV